MKTVLLPVHDDAGQEARLQAALDVVRAISGHLHCLGMIAAPVMAEVSEPTASELPCPREQLAAEHTNRQKLRNRLDHEDVPWTFSDGTAPFALQEAAQLSDLIVVSSNLEIAFWPPFRGAITQTILRTGRPLIAVPPGARSFPIRGHALVAWDGSAGCAAALRAAVPLLRFAGSVVLLEIDDGSIQLPAVEAALYLARYDIHARTARDYALSDPVDRLLLFAIEAQHADYVVLGAYGHRPLTETLFGGVTRTMLAESPVPLFLAH